MEAIIPTEMGVPTLRTKIPKKANTEVIAKDLDMVDELHEAATMINKLIQQACKAVCIKSRRPSLEKGLQKTQLTQQPSNSNRIGKDHT